MPSGAAVVLLYNENPQFNWGFSLYNKTPSLTGGSKSLKLWVEKNNLQSYNKVKVCQPNNKKQRRYRHEKRRYK